ncbi:SDR family oxidoreductase [Streptomyces sp. GbtcB6]|uniref:SDR family oxidoreductase n=1 Tax=Streptomyces sp. GbtcB6 TaxID=2824751 RepID=UPI001C304C33|nr:NAD(P)H-binding protein [Streptomyces sp. GbtcB6]
MILVTGSTGNVGRNIVRELLAAGEQVRALTRNPAGSGLPAEVEVVEGDFTRPETLAAALDGVRRAFLFPLFGELESFLGHARRSGLERLVLLSSSAATFATPGWIGEAHLRNEAEVSASGIDATFVRPSLFMANDLAWADQISAVGVVRGPYAKARMAPVDERDVAAVAAAALTSAGLLGHVSFTGPQALNQVERVRTIAEAHGVTVGFEEIPRSEAHAHLAEHMPPPAADFLLDQLKEAAEGKGEPVSTAEPVIGRPAHTYASWVQHRIADFRR